MNNRRGGRGYGRGQGRGLGRGFRGGRPKAEPFIEKRLDINPGEVPLELTSTEERLREGVEILKQVLEQTRVIKKVLEQQKPKMTQGGFSIN